MSFVALLVASAIAATPDRSTPPSIPPAEPIVLDEGTVEVVRPGLRLHWLPVHGLSDVDLTVVLGGAAPCEGRDGDTRFELTDSAWAWAPRRTHVAGHEHMETEAGVAQLTLTLRLQDLDGGVARLHEIFQDPELPSASAQRRQLKPMLEAQRELDAFNQSKPGMLAWNGTATAWYAPDDPRRPLGKSHKAAHSPEEILACLDHVRATASVDVLVTGDITPDTLRAPLTAALHGWGADGATRPALPPREAGQSWVIGVDNQGSDRVVVAFRTGAPPAGSAEAPAMEAVAHGIAAATLTRRDAAIERLSGAQEDYMSWTTSQDGDGSVYVEIGADTSNVGETLRALQAELADRATHGVSAEATSACGADLVRRWNRTMSAARGGTKLMMAQLQADGAPGEALRALQASLHIDAAELAAVAAKYLTSTDHVIVVVGDRASVEGTFEDVYGAPVWYTPEQVNAGQVRMARAVDTTPSTP